MKRVGASLVRQWRRLWPVSALQRLEDLIPAYRHDLMMLIDSTSKDGDEPQWASKARESLHDAEVAVRERNPEKGWRHFLTAQRLELYGLRDLKPEAFRARAFTLRAEALQKLTSWRRRRVEELFSALPSSAQRSTDKVLDTEFFAASETALILHEHFANEALKARSARSQTRTLIALALAAALGWVWLSGPAVLRISAPNGGALPWDNRDLLASVLLFGLMGAAFSALVSLGRVQTQTIPEQVFTYRITFARQAVGVLSALAVYVLLASELVTVGKLAVTPALVLAAAFASGFSERLVVRALERFAGTVEGTRTERPKGR